MSVRGLLPLASFLIACSFISAQEPTAPPVAIQVPLVVNPDVPLRVYITQRLSMRVDEPVRAKLIEPVYAFDRIIIPSGVELAGQVSSLKPVSKMARFQAILQGDFTPLHWARVEFSSIVMPDGRVIPIKTSASTSLGTIYDPPRPPKKQKANQKPQNPQNNTGVLGIAKQQAKQQVQQQISSRSRGVVDLVRSPNKKEWLEDFLNPQAALSSAMVPEEQSLRRCSAKSYRVRGGGGCHGYAAKCRSAERRVHRAGPAVDGGQLGGRDYG